MRKYALSDLVPEGHEIFQIEGVARREEPYVSSSFEIELGRLMLQLAGSVSGSRVELLVGPGRSTDLFHAHRRGLPFGIFFTDMTGGEYHPCAEQDGQWWRADFLPDEA